MAKKGYTVVPAWRQPGDDEPGTAYPTGSDSSDGGFRRAIQVFTTVDKDGNVVPRAGDIADLLSGEYFTQISASELRLRTMPCGEEALARQLNHLRGVMHAIAEKAQLKLYEGAPEFHPAN